MATGYAYVAISWCFSVRLSVTKPLGAPTSYPNNCVLSSPTICPIDRPNPSDCEFYKKKINIHLYACFNHQTRLIWPSSGIGEHNARSLAHRHTDRHDGLALALRGDLMSVDVQMMD